MKKLVLSGILAVLVCGAANASDGGLYVETETYSNDVRYVEAEAPRAEVARPVANPVRKCGCPSCGACQPVQVKTYSEVIDHYQVYQPVTVYQPAGTYTKRRIVEQPRCARCGM